MSYETPLEVMMGIYNKLKKTKETQDKKILELTLQITYLKPCDNEDSLLKKLEKELDTAECKLADAERQLNRIQKRRDGGASLDSFLTDENLAIVKSSLNETMKDEGIHVDIERK